MYNGPQLTLFENRSINPTAEIKRQIRLVMSRSRMSRDEIVDAMNRIAIRDGIKGTVSKATVDGWCKESDQGRIPSVPLLVVFCEVMQTSAPIAAMAAPLGYGVIGNADMKVLEFGRAELAKRQAAKKAKVALEALDINNAE